MTIQLSRHFILQSSILLADLQASSVYRDAASRYILRHTSRFTVTTTSAITTVEPSNSAKLPESLAREIVAPRPMVV